MRAYSSLKRGESVRTDISGGKEGKEGREKKDDMFFNECVAVLCARAYISYQFFSAPPT
jgi:hypothetical protein